MLKTRIVGTRTIKYADKRKAMKQTDVKSVEENIARKVKEIRDYYYSVNPTGRYLTMAIIDNTIMFNNEYSENDKKFPIDYWENADED